MTQRSPPRRTSSSSESAAERDRPDHAGVTNAAAERAAQYSSSHHSLQAASDGSADPGHLFSLEKTKRHDRLSDSIPKRNDKPADLLPRSGFGPSVFDSSRDDKGHNHPSMSAATLTSSKYGPLRNPTVGLGSSQHAVAAATAQSSKPDGSHSGTQSSDEQPRTDTLPRQGIKSLGISDSPGLGGSQMDTLSVPKLIHAPLGSSDTASRLDEGSHLPAGIACQGTQQGVHAGSKHSMLLAGDDLTSLPDSASEAASEAACEVASGAAPRAASRAAAQPGLQASAAGSPAAAPSQRAADSLSQMHQSMRKANCESRCHASPCHVMLFCQQQAHVQMSQMHDPASVLIRQSLDKSCITYATHMLTTRCFPNI